MPALRRDILPEAGLEARVRANLLAAEYRFAKTMPENPHWYTLRKTWADDRAFVEAVEFMRANGYIEIFKGRKYTMYNLNGYKYWTMGAPINYSGGNPCTILINRAKTAEPADYDAIAERYDELFDDLESYKENVDILRRIGAQPRKRILDIGCGTGLFLDQDGFRLSCRSYTGIDPSAQMLGQLVTRFPEYRGNICHTKFEEFYDAEGFDLIVSLFGASNYIKPEEWARVFDMLRPGGRVFAMFYQEHYFPVTYEKCDVAFSHNQTSEYDLSDFSLEPYKDSFLIARHQKEG